MKVWQKSVVIPHDFVAHVLCEKHVLDLALASPFIISTDRSLHDLS